MFRTDDTIVAIATPPGRGGIGVVRLSGPEAPRVAASMSGRTEPLEPRRATFVRIASAADGGASGVSLTVLGVRDHAIVTHFPAPYSYTGEDVVEISVHGSPVVLESILHHAMHAGARLAEPGEFTLRAFLHGKLDLVQAEAVADLVDAVTPLQARAAFDQLEGTLTQEIGAIEGELFELMARLEASLDFPEEGYHFIEPGRLTTAIEHVDERIRALLAGAARGRLVREGAQVAIVGAPNVGKSSLFNALLNANRAIVAAVPGTTRDVLSERANIGGLSVALVDTAGIRSTIDEVEEEGVRRARGVVDVADLVVVVLDRSRPRAIEDDEILALTERRPRLLVHSKSDLPPQGPAVPGAVDVSVVSGSGLDELVERLGAALGAREGHRDEPRVTNLRHIDLLTRAAGSLLRARKALLESDGAMPEEFVLADLQDASARLQEVTGRRSTDDLLAHIFERFCIGK